MGLRGNCHLGVFFFPRASFFSTFLRTLARSARALLFVIAIFWLAVHFHVLLRVGPACAGSAPRSPRCSWLLCEPRAAAGGCMSVERGGAHFSSSFRCMLVVSRANPSFLHVFRFSRRRLESVCVCVCVSSLCGVRSHGRVKLEISEQWLLALRFLFFLFFFLFHMLTN